VIYDLRDEEQRRALNEQIARQMMLYGNVFMNHIGPDLIILVEPWINRAARHG
jgi:hypothetical protein